MELNTQAIKLMKQIAKKQGFRVKENAGGNWSIRQGNHWRGIIVVIPSGFTPGSPFAVCCRHNNYPELEELRHSMNCALVDAGYLEYAE